MDSLNYFKEETDTGNVEGKTTLSEPGTTHVKHKSRYYSVNNSLARLRSNQPGRLQTACGALWAAYIGVLATLRLEFARTTAFALVGMDRHGIGRAVDGQGRVEYGNERMVRVGRWR